MRSEASLLAANANPGIAVMAAAMPVVTERRLRGFMSAPHRHDFLPWDLASFVDHLLAHRARRLRPRTAPRNHCGLCANDLESLHSASLAMLPHQPGRYRHHLSICRSALRSRSSPARASPHDQQVRLRPPVSPRLIERKAAKALPQLVSLLQGLARRSSNHCTALLCQDPGF